MRAIVVVTGTPGVGKSRLAHELSRREGYKFVDLSHMVKTERLYNRFDRQRRTYVLDEARLRRKLEAVLKSSAKIVIASHALGKFLPTNLVKCVLVLRLDPKVLNKRLRARGWTRQKAWENTEAEIVDVSLLESLKLFGQRRVAEIDTTNKPALEVYKEARRALSNGGSRRIGQVNWLAHYDPVDLERKS